tara:strand:- start:6624 stop:6749 length:126 start_codon:yes stop_codon:yes gene_type:complete
MTLSELQARMSQEEMMGWHAYFVNKSEEEEKAYQAAKRQGR